MSIEAMKQALEALEAVYGESCDAIHALRTAIQQAESEPCKSFTGLRERHREGVDAELAEMEAENKPAGEPVAWIDLRDGDIVQLGDRLLSGGKTWRTVDLESNLIGRAYRAKQWWPMQRAYTHPAPGVPDALKDHQIAAMVNTLRDIARQFHGHDSLRERIANVLVPALKAEANADEPVAWIRRHPNGALSNELLIHVQVEQVRRDSGAWVPLYTHPAPGVPDDAKRLNWLDDTNKRFRMGWEVGQAPAGNVSIRTIITGGKSIRDAIDAAMLTAARAQKGGAA